MPNLKSMLFALMLPLVIASCGSTPSAPVSKATDTSSLGNAGTPQLTEPAKQDYYDLLRNDGGEQVADCISAGL